MASVDVYTAVKSHLATTFGGVYSVLDFDEIDDALEQGTDPFLVIEEAGGGEALFCFGDPAALGHMEDGALEVHCFTPAPESSSAARAIADSVRDALRLQNLNGVRVTGVDPPEPETQNDGLWTAFSVSVTFDLARYFASP